MDVKKQAEPWQRYQMKQKAMQYYQENKVPEIMERVLNLMFIEDPFDVYGYVANYFEAYAKPVTIEKLQASIVWDCRGEPTVHIEIYCLIKNHTKLVASVVSPGYDSVIGDHLMMSKLREEKQKKQISMETAVDYINGSLGELFIGKELLNSQPQADAMIRGFLDPLQSAVDEEKKKQESESTASTVSTATEAEHGAKKIARKKSAKPISARTSKTKIDVSLPYNDPAYEWIPGSPAGSALSQAICIAEATLREVQLYEVFASIAAKDKQVPTSYRMPLLMTTLLHCGKSAGGKLRAFEEVLLIPSNQFSVKESVSHLLSIHDHMISIILEHHPKHANFINSVSDIGSITVPFDKPDQILDLVIDSIEAANLQPGKDFSIAINCASHHLMELEKGVYNFVLGVNQKSLEDAVEFWIDLVKNYPAIVALIDPIRKKEEKACAHLCKNISGHCLIIGDYNVPCEKRQGSESKEIKPTGPPEGKEIKPPGPPEGSDIVSLSTEESSYVTSGQILRIEPCTTITDFLNSVGNLTEKESYAIPSVSRGQGKNTFIADLAVASRCRFLKTGGLRGERFQVLNRLIHIENNLTKEGKLEEDTDQWTFPQLVVKTASRTPSEQSKNLVGSKQFSD